MCGAKWRKPAHQITDRAARYRATSPECRPPDPRVCGFCGSTANVEVHHIDGYEENAEPFNLMWTCRSCNTRIGIVMARAGLGRKTRQFNPSARGAENLQQWLNAVLSMKGESHTMPVSKAVEMIHATPQYRRSEFAHEIWAIRREHGTDRMPPF